MTKLSLGNKLTPSFFIETWHRHGTCKYLAQERCAAWADGSKVRASWRVGASCGKQQLFDKHEERSWIFHTEVDFPQSSNVLMGHVVCGKHSRVIILCEGASLIAHRSNTVFSGLTAVWRVCPTLSCNIQAASSCSGLFSGWILMSLSTQITVLSTPRKNYTSTEMTAFSDLFSNDFMRGCCAICCLWNDV